MQLDRTMHELSLHSNDKKSRLVTEVIEDVSHCGGATKTSDFVMPTFYTCFNCKDRC